MPLNLWKLLAKYQETGLYNNNTITHTYTKLSYMMYKHNTCIYMLLLGEWSIIRWEYDIICWRHSIRSIQGHRVVPCDVHTSEVAVSIVSLHRHPPEAVAHKHISSFWSPVLQNIWNLTSMPLLGKLCTGSHHVLPFKCLRAWDCSFIEKEIENLPFFFK